PFKDARLDNRLINIANSFYEMPEASIPQACGTRAATEGAYRFLNKLWRIVLKDNVNQKFCKGVDSGIKINSNTELTVDAMRLLRKTHQTIKKVTKDIEREYHFNTAIAALMELANDMSTFNIKTDGDEEVFSFAVKNIILMIAPFAPHIAEEMWQRIGKKNSIFEHPWPYWDEELAKEEEVELVVQVNGRVRAKMLIPAGLSDDEVKERALSEPKISEITRDAKIKRIVVVQGRLVNIVI
ncbi:MAG: class I tRNA ligase family protein, partial [Thermodesulfovibrionales bacterium]|nr:class I tRNA ligase family protein [Thermodesulfovibrionales bacterium]